MKSGIELHDSELLEVDLKAGTILLDAYVHRDAPGIRREGGTQYTLFRFSNFRVTVHGGQPLGTIVDGTLDADGVDLNGLIPLPFAASTPVEMRLVLIPDGVVATFVGDALTIEEAGPYKFIESWRGDE